MAHRTITEALAPYQVQGLAQVGIRKDCSWDGCPTYGQSMFQNEWLCNQHRAEAIRVWESFSRYDTEG